MKSYKLVFGDISPIIENDIKNVLKNKIKLYPREDADITYRISSYGGIPLIEKQNRIYDNKCITKDILFKETLWDQFLFHIKKTDNTSVISSSFIYEDNALDLSNKLGCANILRDDMDNLIIVGNDIHEGDLGYLRLKYLNTTISMISLHSNNIVDYLEYCDIIHIISTNYSTLMKYNNVNIIDIVSIITDKIVSDFYSI
jgi:hypothetical protein